MNETAELMARREKYRIKQMILGVAEKRCFVTISGETRSSIIFNSYRANIDTGLYGYTSIEQAQIMKELTLEIIDELTDDLAKTKARILAGGEI